MALRAVGARFPGWRRRQALSGVSLCHMREQDAKKPQELKEFEYSPSLSPSSSCPQSIRSSCHLELCSLEDLQNFARRQKAASAEFFGFAHVTERRPEVQDDLFFFFFPFFLVHISVASSLKVSEYPVSSMLLSLKSNRVPPAGVRAYTSTDTYREKN